LTLFENERSLMMNESIQYPRFRWLVLFTASLGFAAMQINMIAYAPLLADIAKNLGVDMGAATNLMTVFLITASIALIVGGILCDRYGIMFVIILGLLCTSVPATLMPWIGSSYQAVLWARIIQGFSAGFLLCTMAPIMAIWIPLQEKGLASGLMNGSVTLGSAVGVLSAPAVFLALKNWQQMIAWLSIPCWAALLLAIMVVFSPKPQGLLSQSQTSEVPVADGSALKRALSAPITWIGVLVTFFTAWCFQSLYNLTPAYFAADKPVGIGFGPMLSGKLMLAVMIAGMLGPVIGGLLQDKVFRGRAKPVLLIGFALSCVFIYAILFPAVYANMAVLIVCLILVGAGNAFLYPAIVVFISGTYPVHIVGKMLGLWFGIGAFGGAAGLFAGSLAVGKFGNYNVAISLVSLAAVVGFIFALFMVRPK
jgi:MFS family permease